MSFIIAAIAVGTIAFAFAQAWLMRCLRSQYSRPTPLWPQDRPWPKVAVVLSLRGRDPFLETCLGNLLQQDYPAFRLQVIVDSATDPAWDAIRAVQTRFGADRFCVSVLRERRPNCSLKNSSILQAINDLKDDEELVAFVDADAITHRTWLRELVSPLADPEVGCSTGIRWFAPANQSLATRMRCYWNLIAAAVIYQSSTPWGGSMVVRRSILESGLADEWSRMFCEDAHTINHLNRRGLKLVCVPEATVVNQETTSVSGCVKFVNRQTLIFRLYHRQWWAVMGMIAFGAVLRTVHWRYIIHSLVWGDMLSLIALVCIHPIILLVIRYEGCRLDAAVRKMVAKTGREIPRNPTPDFAGYFATEIMFLGSLLYSLGARQVTWRGISYDINGPQDITMLAYKSYSEPSLPSASSTTVV